MPRPIVPLMDRWEANVLRSEGCWLWMGARRADGYGVLNSGRDTGYKILRAHRIAYEAFVGPIPHGLEIRHQCHNRQCVNPAHLLVGTRAENIQDRIDAGRPGSPGTSGSRNGLAKLDEQKVARIKQLLASGSTLTAIAREYGVTKSAIWSIKQGITWRKP